MKLASAIFVIVGIVARPVLAQEKRDVETTPVEVVGGVTINALLRDINSTPDCLQLSLPCTHETPNKFAGFGLDLAVARNVNDRLAIVADLSAFEHRWD